MNKYVPKMKVAFTLPEVLMVILIVSVIAAMTIPNLITGTYEYTTIRKVKKFHSAINQAMRLAYDDVGEITDWNLPSNKSQAATQFVNTLCSYYKCGIDYGFGKEQKTFTHTYQYLGGNNKWSTYKSSATYRLLGTLDGGLLFINIHDSKCAYNTGEEDFVGGACGIIIYDVNGKWLPNTYGKDFFEFLIKKDSIVPRTKEKDKCYLKKNQGQGVGCVFHVIYNSTMDYLH